MANSSFQDGPKGRTRNPYSAALGLWIPGSQAEFIIGPRFARTRWPAPGMTATYSSRSSWRHLALAAARDVEKNLFHGVAPVAGEQPFGRIVVFDAAPLHDDDALA